jgi:putative membrane protein
MRDVLSSTVSRLRRNKWRTGIAVLAVPLTVAGVLTWSFSDGMTNHGTAVAAIVNNDEPVTIGEQYVPLGRQLAAELVGGQDSRYDWQLTNDEDASEGLASGKYEAVVTVPPSFSQRATSSATATDPLTAQQGMITLATSREAALADSVLSQEVTDAAVTALNKQIVQTYLDNIYFGFTTMHDEMGRAVDGATQLADGTGQLVDGSGRVHAGSQTLLVGLNQLADATQLAYAGSRELAAGARELADGTGQLAAGSRDLANGTGELVAGADQLASGLDQAAARTANLPAQTRELANGAREVADGNRQIADTVAPLANGAVLIIDSVPDLSGYTAQMQALAAQCDVILGSIGAGNTQIPVDTAQFCAQLVSTANQVAANAEAIDARKYELRDQVVQVSSSLERLADGAEQVADGAERLADAAPELTAGIRQASDGANELESGARRVDAGANDLAAGAATAAAGAKKLAAGSAELSGGLAQVVDGSGQAERGAADLTDGAGQVVVGATEADAGANELATGLADAREQIPTYTERERSHLSGIAAVPAFAEFADGGLASRIAGSLFLVLALWVGGMGIYLALRPVRHRVLESRRSTWNLVLRSLAPGVGVAALSGFVLGLGMSWVLEFTLQRTVTVTAVATVIGISFAVLNQALAAVLGTTGRVIALGILVLTTVVGLLSTVPSGVEGLAGVLPTHAAAVALRAVAAGGAGLSGALVGLAAWTLVAFLVSIYATERRRIVVLRRFHQLR